MKLHSLLNRQLNRIGISDNYQPRNQEEWEAFLEIVSKTYEGVDRDRYLLERSLSISSREMQEEITRRIQAEQEAIDLGIERERKNIITRFVENVSHELRTPMSIILTRLFLLKKSTVDEGQVERINVIQNQINTIASLFEILVLMSKLDSGIDMKIIRFNINSMFQALIENKKSLLASKGISLLAETGEVIYFVGDQKNLNIAINEIVKNAIFFTLDEGQIIINLERKSDYIQIQVSDTGIGILPEHLPKIFDRFYRIDSARTNSGWGLGLTIAKMIIEAHKGVIEVESHVGVGTTFRIILPLVSAESSSEEGR